MIESIIGAGVNLLGQQMNIDAQERQQTRNFDYSKKLIDYQNQQTKALTSWNNQNSYVQQKNGLLNAGINPSAMSNTSASSMSQSSSANVNYPATQVDMSGVANAVLSAAQNRMTNAQAHQQELQNEILEDQIDAAKKYAKSAKGYIIDGEFHSINDPKTDKLVEDYKKKYSALPELVVPSERLSVDAYNVGSNIKSASANAESASNNAKATKLNLSKFALESKLAEKQMNNPMLMDCLANMPLQSYNQLTEQVQSIRWNNKLSQIQYNYEKIVSSEDVAYKQVKLLETQINAATNDNIGELWDRLANEGFSWKNSVLLIAAMLSQIGGTAKSFGVSFNHHE